ncbi:MAG: alpha/beta superfamily hydrolase [Rhodospirillaceae bacterium]|nr:MAG: alpha/beta superfamily hydrolase [Rhodospirillaceae bacterium]
MPEIIFNGPQGRLEGRYHHATKSNPPVALILHPHPQHGGNMNNRIVYGLYQTLARRGFSLLRFNFRGVGRSQGVFNSGMGELADAAAALDWLQNANIGARGCWVTGYSFGAWVGLHLLMRRPEITTFIAVSPPVALHDFSFLAPCPASGLIVHGTNDAFVSEATVAHLADRLARQRGPAVMCRTIAGADHFYRDHLEVLVREIEAYVDRMDLPPTRDMAP